MTTRFTLNVSKDEMDPQSGHGVQQNATVTSDNPEDLIAALTQLAGVATAANNYGATAVTASDCGCSEDVEEDYANSPEEQTYDAPGGVGDLVGTGHTASAKNRYTKAGFGDNPLAEGGDTAETVLAKCGTGELDCYDVMNSPKTPAEKEASRIISDMYDDISIDHHLHPDDNFEEIFDIIADRLAQDYGTNERNEDLEESLSALLMTEWKETKLQAVSDEFDTDAAIQAITEGKKEYVKGSKKFAVRMDESVAKVYPVMENRTLMTMPLFVIDTAALVKESDKPSHAADTTMKHIKNPTKGEKDAAKDIKPGIAGYKDRIDMLKSAEKDGRLKEDETVNEEDSRDSVIGAITRRIMMQHTEVLRKFGPVRVMAAIEDKAEYLDDLDEIGSSDVSIWTKEVIDDLEKGHYNDADPDMPVREDDMEEGKLRDLGMAAALGATALAGGAMAKGEYDYSNKKIAGSNMTQADLDKVTGSDSRMDTWRARGEKYNEGDFVSTLSAMSAARYQPKVGDKIRTRKGGQIPGTVEKVGEVSGIEYCWFRHPEGKMYKTPCSNVMREEAEDAVKEESGVNIEMEDLHDILALAGMHEAKKPDFLDMDKDGDKEEPMSKAVKDKEEKVDEAKPDFLDLDKDGDKEEPMKDAAKDKKVEEGTCSVCNEDPCCCEDKKMDESADVDYIKSLLKMWK